MSIRKISFIVLFVIWLAFTGLTAGWKRDIVIRININLLNSLSTKSFRISCQRFLRSYIIIQVSLRSQFLYSLTKIGIISIITEHYAVIQSCMVAHWTTFYHQNLGKLSAQQPLSFLLTILLALKGENTVQYPPSDFSWEANRGFDDMTNYKVLSISGSNN